MLDIFKQILRARLFSLNIGAYRIAPGIVPTLMTIAFVYLMMFMGQWQAEKAEYKENLTNKIVARKDLPPIGLMELPAKMDDRLYLPVRIYGRYDTKHSFLLDNKIVNGQVGYDVYSPLIKSDGEAILVNRGFLPQGRTRQDLPEFVTPADALDVIGLLDNTPSKTIVLADDVNKVKSWPVVLQYVDVAEISAMLGYPVFNMVLWLDKDDNHGFERTLPALNLGAAKNAGYAFQWYAMTFALLTIFVVVNIKKRE